jgi:hypothetical protein
MKRLALCLVAFSLLALSGCVTYKVYDATENRQLSQEQEFKKGSSASNFSIVNDSTMWVIKLDYVAIYDAYTITKYGSFLVHYRQPTMVENRWGDARPVGAKEKLDESETKEWSREALSLKNAKVENKTIDKGQTLTLYFPSGSSQTFTLNQNGILPLDNTVCSQILSAISNPNDLRSVKVECKPLGVSQSLDLSSVASFNDAVTTTDDLNRVLASYKVVPTDPQQRYDDSQRAILDLAKTYRYGYQWRLIQAVFDANYQAVAKALQVQINSLQASIPTFIIQGQINDSGDGWIQVWGMAIPRPVTAQTMRSPGYQSQPANLIVEDPDDSGVHGNAYVFMTNYFVAKESGVNSLGGPVPVYRYTTKIPATYQPIGAQIADLQAKLDAVTKAHTDASPLFSAE